MPGDEVGSLVLVGPTSGGSGRTNFEAASAVQSLPARAGIGGKTTLIVFAAPALAPTHLLPTCEVGTIVGTASASAAHILVSQQRHGPRRRRFRAVPEPRGGERPRHLADVRTRRPNPTANRENRRPGRASLPSVWTIHPSHSRAYKNLPDHTPSQLTKPSSVAPTTRTKNTP